MRGPGEVISFATEMGLWSFTSTGHYHNDNMYSNMMPDAKGFPWTDDYEVQFYKHETRKNTWQHSCDFMCDLSWFYFVLVFFAPPSRPKLAQ